jgi:phosphatase 1 regulatory subunit 12b
MFKKIIFNIFRQKILINFFYNNFFSLFCLVVSPSPPSAPTPVTESETQRKAHAKRVRETRRSTQGVSLDDVNRARDQLKQAAVSSIEPFKQGTKKKQHIDAIFIQILLLSAK